MSALVFGRLPGEVCTLPGQTLRVMGGLKLDPQALADLKAQLGLT